MTKWWGRQPDPFDVDPIWTGPFDSEAEALASLRVPPGEHWGGSLSEEADDFDPSATVTRPAVASGWTAAVKALARVDDFPFLSEAYMNQTRVALAAFQAAATSLAGSDDERAAKAEEVVAGLELFLAQPWPADPSLVETRSFDIDDRPQSEALSVTRVWTEQDRIQFVRVFLGPGASDDDVARARQNEWDDDSIDMALYAGG